MAESLEWELRGGWGIKVWAGILIWLSLTTTVWAGPVVFTGTSSDMDFVVEQVVPDLDVPWGMAFLGSGELLFTQRNGRVGLLDTETGRVTWIKHGQNKIHHRGQGGLLDVALPPDWRAGDWIYFTYARSQGKRGATTLARARLAGHELVDWEDLLVTRSAFKKNIHFGSRMAFDDRGHLYFTVGDRGHRPNGQDLSTHAGSVLRVGLEGGAAGGNPFVKTAGALAEIYSFGHRNPQGIAFDKKTGRLWINEHGPRGGDEINLIRAGRNYGWPVISHGKEYWGPVQVGEGTAKPGMEQPVKYYTPSIAPGSLLLYSGKAFPAWVGNLFSGALAMQHLNRVALDENGIPVAEERLLESLEERIRALAQSPEGWIYFSTDDTGIYRIRPPQ